MEISFESLRKATPQRNQDGQFRASTFGVQDEFFRLLLLFFYLLFFLNEAARTESRRGKDCSRYGGNSTS